jgi:hypothetical protein
LIFQFPDIKKTPPGTGLPCDQFDLFVLGALFRRIQHGRDGIILYFPVTSKQDGPSSCKISNELQLDEPSSAISKKKAPEKWGTGIAQKHGRNIHVAATDGSQLPHRWHQRPTACGRWLGQNLPFFSDEIDH